MRKVRHLGFAVPLTIVLCACAGQREARPPTIEPVPNNPKAKVAEEPPQRTGAAPSHNTDAVSEEEQTKTKVAPGAETPGNRNNAAGEVAQGKSEGTPTSSEPAKTAVEPAAQGRGIKEVCENLTQRAKQKCTKQVAEMYESSCSHYVKAKNPCEEQQRLFLECQLKAPDARLCAHEADQNCAAAHRELKTCQRGAAPESQLEPEDDHTLPPDWTQVKDSVLGFTCAMPPGAALDASSKRRTWTAEAGGISYHVAELEAPSGKLDNQTYVRTLVSYVSSRCQRGMKLRGDLEVKGTTVVQYQTTCPDKTEWRGMLHFWNGKAVSTAYHAPAGVRGVELPFFYSLVIDGQQR